MINLPFPWDFESSEFAEAAAALEDAEEKIIMKIKNKQKVKKSRQKATKHKETNKCKM
jgi:hypothetical protein